MCIGKVWGGQKAAVGERNSSQSKALEACRHLSKRKILSIKMASDSLRDLRWDFPASFIISSHHSSEMWTSESGLKIKNKSQLHTCQPKTFASISSLAASEILHRNRAWNGTWSVLGQQVEKIRVLAARVEDFEQTKRKLGLESRDKKKLEEYTIIQMRMFECVWHHVWVRSNPLYRQSVEKLKTNRKIYKYLWTLSCWDAIWTCKSLSYIVMYSSA